MCVHQGWVNVGNSSAYFSHHPWVQPGLKCHAHYLSLASFCSFCGSSCNSDSNQLGAPSMKDSVLDPGGGNPVIPTTDRRIHIKMTSRTRNHLMVALSSLQQRNRGAKHNRAHLLMGMTQLKREKMSVCCCVVTQTLFNSQSQIEEKPMELTQKCKYIRHTVEQLSAPTTEQA